MPGAENEGADNTIVGSMIFKNLCADVEAMPRHGRALAAFGCGGDR
jgi:hypothetical protein